MAAGREGTFPSEMKWNLKLPDPGLPVSLFLIFKYEWAKEYFIN
jgi:hypothetical protein